MSAPRAGSTHGYVKVNRADWDQAQRALLLQPVLLAALRDLLPLAECYVRDHQSHGDRLDAARAAIAQAVES